MLFYIRYIMSNVKTVSKKTIERYSALWNKIQAINFDLSDILTISYLEFNQRIGSKSKINAQYKLAKSIAHNIERQKQVNKLLDDKNIPNWLIKRLKEINYLEFIEIPPPPPKPFNPEFPTIYHKFENLKRLLNKPKGFAGKIVFTYKFQEVLIGINGFRYISKRNKVNNWIDIYDKIVKDLTIINSHYYTLYENMLSSIGFAYHIETYNPITKNYFLTEFGQQTKLSGSANIIKNEQHKKLKKLAERFNEMNIAEQYKANQKLLYHIYISRIRITLYFMSGSVELPLIS